MLSAVIMCIGIMGQRSGSIVGVAAAKAPPPSGTPTATASSSSWGRNNENNSYRSTSPDDDIPIMGKDHFRNRPKMNGDVSRRRSQRTAARRRRRVNGSDGADKNGSSHEWENNNEPPIFLGDDHYVDDDNGDDVWPQRKYYDRRHKRRKQKANHHPFDSFRHWALDKTGVHIPRINLHVDPITILKIRKSWHTIIPGAIIRAGADFESKGAWRLRGCVEDKLIGGRLTIKKMKNEDNDDRAVLMEYSKSWLFAGAGKLDGTLSINLHRSFQR